MQQCWEQVPSKRPTFPAIEELLIAAISRDLLSSKRSYVKRRRIKTAPTYTSAAPAAASVAAASGVGLPAQLEAQAPTSEPGGSSNAPDARPEIARWLQLEEEDTAEYHRAEAFALTAQPQASRRTSTSREGVLTFRHSFTSSAAEERTQSVGTQPVSAALQRARAAARIKRIPGVSPNPAPGLRFDSV